MNMRMNSGVPRRVDGSNPLLRLFFENTITAIYSYTSYVSALLFSVTRSLLVFLCREKCPFQYPTHQNAPEPTGKLKAWLIRIGFAKGVRNCARKIRWCIAKWEIYTVFNPEWGVREPWREKSDRSPSFYGVGPPPILIITMTVFILNLPLHFKIACLCLLLLLCLVLFDQHYHSRSINCLRLGFVRALLRGL